MVHSPPANCITPGTPELVAPSGHIEVRDRPCSERTDPDLEEAVDGNACPWPDNRGDCFVDAAVSVDEVLAASSLQVR
jgi:hypothetical protein